MVESWSGYGLSQPIHVLIVEDSAGDARLAEIMLRDIGGGAHRASVVQTMGQALTALRQLRPDVVLTDLGLPDAQGVDTVRSLRAVSPDIPIVVLTNMDEDMIGVDTIRAGSDDFVCKQDMNADGLERSLRYAIERRRLARELVANIFDGVLVLGDQGVVRFANPAAATLLGTAESDIVGTVLDLDFGVGERTLVPLAGDPPAVVEIEARTIDWYGEPATLCTMHDVTAQIRASELRTELEHASRLATMGELSAMVAHDINNVLTHLVATITMAREDLDAGLGDEVTRGYLSDANLAVDRIVTIVRDMRVLGEQPVSRPQPVAINDVIREALRITETELVHCATVTTNFGELPTIFGDRVKLLQMLVNLLVNGAHAISDADRAELGHIEITTELRGESIRITVSDDGAGFDPSVGQRLFEPFFTTRNSDGGTGLGLAVAADAANRHSGTIKAISELGAGATFEIDLPVAPTIGGPVKPRLQLLTNDEPRTSGGRVLLVDDDPLVRRVFARTLSAEHEVVQTESAEKALEILEGDRRFDAIVSDLMMPGMDGAQLYDHVVQLDSALATRMVFISGGVFTPRARAFVKDAPVPILQKPLGGRALRQAVADVLRRSQNDDAA